MSMTSNNPLNRPDHFNQIYDKHVKHLHLQGLRANTMMPIHEEFVAWVRILTMKLSLYRGSIIRLFFCFITESFMITVKLDLYGLKFFYVHVLKRCWQDIPLVKSPRVKRLPDVLTIEEVCLLLAKTRILSYRSSFDL